MIERRYAVDIQASLDDVWRALTTADGLRSWLVIDAKVRDGVGGEVYVDWGLGQAGSERIEIWEPGQRLRLSWGPEVEPEDGAAPAAQEWFLRHEDGVTHLRLVMSMPGEGEWEGEDDLDRGWAVFFDALRFYLEDAGGELRRSELRSATTALPRAEAWRKVAESLGLPLPLEVGQSIDLGLDAPATVRVAFDGTLSAAIGDDATLLLDLEGEPPLLLYALASTHGDDTADRAARRAALVDVSERACAALSS